MCLLNRLSLLLIFIAICFVPVLCVPRASPHDVPLSHAASSYDAHGASEAAHRYAQQYIRNMHQPSRHTAKSSSSSSSSSSPSTAEIFSHKPPVFPSFYDTILQQQQHILKKQREMIEINEAQQRKQSHDKQKHHKHSSPTTTSSSSSKHHHAKPDALSPSFMELHTHIEATSHTAAKTNTNTNGFPEQEWTYKDASSPPDYLSPSEALGGVPTTKPPPVPKMIKPPPPVAVPTWMSPFAEHENPHFPHSNKPAPFWGMGPPPPSPPKNFIPLDTFLSPEQAE